MGEDVWVAIIATVGVAVSSIAAALSAVAIARINATKTDVTQAKDQASQANLAAVAARNYSRLATEFLVSKATISLVISRKRWAHVA